MFGPEGERSGRAAHRLGWHTSPDQGGPSSSATEPVHRALFYEDAVGFKLKGPSGFRAWSFRLSPARAASENLKLRCSPLFLQLPNMLRCFRLSPCWVAASKCCAVGWDWKFKIGFWLVFTSQHPFPEGPCIYVACTSTPGMWLRSPSGLTTRAFSPVVKPHIFIHRYIHIFMCIYLYYMQFFVCVFMYVFSSI